MNEQARERGSSRVSLTRRALAAVVDLTVLVVIFAVAWIMLSPTDAQIAKALAIDPSRAGAQTLAFRFIGGLFADPMSALLIALCIGAVLFAVIPMVSKGRTIGKTLVGVRIVKADGSDAPAWSYWMRYLASAFFLLVPLGLILLAPEEIEGVSNNALFRIVGLIVVVWVLTIVARVIGSFSGYPYVSLSEVVSGTRLAPANQNTASGAATASRRSERSAGRQGDDHGEQLEGHDSNYESERDAYDERWPNDPQGGHRDDQPGSTVAFNTRSDQVNRQSAPQSGRATAPAEDDHGKQAALDSLLAVNYDELHPVAGAATSNAPTRAIPQSLPAEQAGAAPDLPTRQINAPADQTRRITDPNVQRKIRRDQRPDAGGTQVFKKQ